MVAIVGVDDDYLENDTPATIGLRAEDGPRLLAHKTILAIDNEALIVLPGFQASAVVQHPRWVANPWID